MASQEQPVQITAKKGKFKVLRNLPGRRGAAKAWYDYLANFLEKKGVQFSIENPCLGKRGDKLFILLHVNGMMVCGFKDEAQKLFWKSSRPSLSLPTRLPSRYAETMAKSFEEKYWHERVELGYVIKQLASGMGNPTYGHLRVMKKLVGYFNTTLENYSHLQAPSYGKGIHHHYDGKWILESFTDSDWSGDRATCVLDRQFCNRQIANKRGSSRLRHVSGKLLWVQDQASAKTLEVKQIGTAFNVDGIGTKPLGRHRLYALMFWCNIYDKHGNPIREEEATKVKENTVTKTKIMRAYRALQRELQRVQDQQAQMIGRQGELTLETNLLRTHVNAMRLALVRLGGYVVLNVSISEQDWDNWRCVERMNRVEDDRVCRRGLRHLRVSTGALRRRRHAAPPVAGGSLLMQADLEMEMQHLQRR
eukprot:s1031_g19.t1